MKDQTLWSRVVSGAKLFAKLFSKKEYIIYVFFVFVMHTSNNQIYVGIVTNLNELGMSDVHMAGVLVFSIEAIGSIAMQSFV